MIKVEREPDSFGDLLEHCCFCKKPTAYWYVPNDVACCQTCAGKHNAEDVPTKEEWCKQE